MLHNFSFFKYSNDGRYDEEALLSQVTPDLLSIKQWFLFIWQVLLRLWRRLDLQQYKVMAIVCVQGILADISEVQEKGVGKCDWGPGCCLGCQKERIAIFQKLIPLEEAKLS